MMVFLLFLSVQFRPTVDTTRCFSGPIVMAHLGITVSSSKLDYEMPRLSFLGHYSAQYSGGAHGPMVIHGPKHEEYDIDVGPIILEDWFHADYYSLVEGTMNGLFPPSNNNLINGRMNYPCANTTLPCTPNAGTSKFKFESGKKHLLRLINMGAEGNQKFSIDGHQLKVIAVDYIPVEPYMTNVVTLAVGQRTDVVVSARPRIPLHSD